MAARSSIPFADLAIPSSLAIFKHLHRVSTWFITEFFHRIPNAPRPLWIIGHTVVYAKLNLSFDGAPEESHTINLTKKRMPKSYALPQCLALIFHNSSNPKADHREATDITYDSSPALLG